MNKTKLLILINKEGNTHEAEYKGYKITLNRHPILSHWCGYVHVPKEDIVGSVYDIVCHGGVTADYEEDGLRVIGFDTAHVGDLCPYQILSDYPSRFNGLLHDSTYRTKEYCIEQCMRMVNQIIAKRDRDKEKEEGKTEKAKQVEMAKKVEELKEIMKNMTSQWEKLEDTSFIDEEYPFDASFDEMVMKVMDWSSSINKKLGL